MHAYIVAYYLHMTIYEVHNGRKKEISLQIGRKGSEVSAYAPLATNTSTT
jgi:hypothetical protein